MAEEYVSQVLLEVDGQSITDFKSVEEGDEDLWKPVNLMAATGHIKGKERPKVKVEYVIPFDTTPFDFRAVKGGKLTIDYQNGQRISYSSVYTTKIGSIKHDGDKESTCTIEFSAKKRSAT